ncbi:MAG: glutamine synthetase family protein [Thiofilum sp.]|uniref:glutamine synthetase family protein n=1 Tax=Thiofilum sp. TaxID=2212733 RepID=UPI0025F8C655|nr:glutamine synthetase family protein [Thiofilum sp.]MBK8452420.1 glutamine synthetase [Thiofilum sp.]
MNSELEKWMHKHQITEVECLIPDITGNARGKIIPAAKFYKDEGMRMPETMFMQTVTGDWAVGDDDHDALEVDMIAIPDPTTARLLPWAPQPTAQVIHDCTLADGTPSALAPRNVLKRILKEYDSLGLKPIIAPEAEFYITKINTDPDYPLEPPIGRSGRKEIGRQAYSIDAVNQFDPLFEDVYDYCEAQELDIDTLIHEAGAGQMEFNFVHGDPLSLADQVFVFKRTMREAALRHNMYATFMAKPLQNEPGSAMHVHQSIVDAHTGLNIFSNPDGSVSERFLQFIAGQQKYLPSVMAILAPNVNSYRRIARFNAAPINTAWGYDNRTVGLRVPHSDPSNRRVENRLSGADVNPYLMFAASFACGLLGIRQQLQPTAPMETSAYNLPFGVPRDLRDSLVALESCEPVVELLGERFVEVYCKVKRMEYEAFFQVISSWEREYLLLNV